MVSEILNVIKTESVLYKDQSKYQHNQDRQKREPTFSPFFFNTYPSTTQPLQIAPYDTKYIKIQDKLRKWYKINKKKTPHHQIKNQLVLQNENC